MKQKLQEKAGSSGVPEGMPASVLESAEAKAEDTSPGQTLHQGGGRGEDMARAPQGTLQGVAGEQIHPPPKKQPPPPGSSRWGHAGRALSAAEQGQQIHTQPQPQGSCKTD
ncbi:hypothetical protein P7K49_011132 [Saguinus oedipus]|uniref:Uncharacterized protein n=1 Tax=Saguinus oedipus TaxID=9490 RepID=A0ABQ9VPU4_SAGOE|nr:hypothetical protein P7K49_011132 [Saguinus oedipus]